MLSRKEQMQDYETWLRLEEKSPATIEKYVRSVKCFMEFVKEDISKELVIRYKEELKRKYKPTGVNTQLTISTRSDYGTDTWTYTDDTVFLLS